MSNQWKSLNARLHASYTVYDSVMLTHLESKWGTLRLQLHQIICLIWRISQKKLVGVKYAVSNITLYNQENITCYMHHITCGATAALLLHTMYPHIDLQAF